MMMKHWKIFVGSMLVLSTSLYLGAQQAAEAFPYNNLWGMPAAGMTPQNRAGAGNIYGTGGPFEGGIQCVHCHIEPANNIVMDFAFVPALVEIGNDFEYVPGQTYNVMVTMMNESLETNGFDLNAFAVTFEDAGGTLQGELHSDSGHSQSGGCPDWTQLQNTAMQDGHNTTFMTNDCHGVISSHIPDATQWAFSWDAPSGGGAGEVIMWWGATDGNNEGESSLDDDTVQGSMRLLPMP